MSPLVLLVASAALSADAKPLNTPPPGFTLLFNGKDLTHWKQDEKDALAHWKVVCGTLHYDRKGDTPRNEKNYGDVELYVDWKIGKAGDSGIYLRSNPQVQIWDNPVGSGGLFNNEKNPSKPTKVADKPVGEWNTFHIIIKGDKVT